MSYFLKNLPKSFFRAVVSSRPIFVKANSLFPSIANHAQPKLPVLAVGRTHAKSICFGNPNEDKRKQFLKKYRLPSRYYSSKKSQKKSAGKVIQGPGVSCTTENGPIECTIDCEALAGGQEQNSKAKTIEVPDPKLKIITKTKRCDSTKPKVDVKDLTGTWVSKKCIKFDFKKSCQPQDSTESKPVKVDKSKNCPQLSKDHPISKQNAGKKAKPLPLKKASKKKTDSKEDVKTSSKQSDGSKKKSCKPCSKKKDLKKSNSSKNVQDSQQGGSKLVLASYQELQNCQKESTKKPTDCEKETPPDSEKKKSSDCTAIPPPKLDGKLPEPKEQDKDLISGGKSFVKTVCDGIFPKTDKAKKSATKKAAKPTKSKSAPVVKKKKSKNIKKSKSADCKVDVKPASCDKPKSKPEKSQSSSSCKDEKPKKSASCKSKKPEPPCKPTEPEAEKGDVCAKSSKSHPKKTRECKPKPTKSSSKKSVKTKATKKKSTDKCSQPDEKTECSEKKSKDTDTCSKENTKPEVKKKKSKSKVICSQQKKHAAADKKKSETCSKDKPKKKKSEKSSASSATKKTPVTKCGSCTKSKSKPKVSESQQEKSDSCSKPSPKPTKRDCASPKPKESDPEREMIVDICAKASSACPPEDKNRLTSTASDLCDELPDQSPIMQCIAMCRKKKKADAPQSGKGIPARDKKPCSSDINVYKKVVPYKECKAEKTEKKDEIKPFIPCKYEDIKPGIRNDSDDSGKNSKIKEKLTTCQEDNKKKPSKPPPKKKKLSKEDKLHKTILDLVNCEKIAKLKEETNCKSETEEKPKVVHKKIEVCVEAKKASKPIPKTNQSQLKKVVILRPKSKIKFQTSAKFGKISFHSYSGASKIVHVQKMKDSRFSKSDNALDNRIRKRSKHTDCNDKSQDKNPEDKCECSTKSCPEFKQPNDSDKTKKSKLINPCEHEEKKPDDYEEHSVEAIVLVFPCKDEETKCKQIEEDKFEDCHENPEDICKCASENDKFEDCQSELKVPAEDIMVCKYEDIKDKVLEKITKSKPKNCGEESKEIKSCNYEEIKDKVYEKIIKTEKPENCPNETSEIKPCKYEDIKDEILSKISKSQDCKDKTPPKKCCPKFRNPCPDFQDKETKCKKTKKEGKKINVCKSETKYIKPFVPCKFEEIKPGIRQPKQSSDQVKDCKSESEDKSKKLKPSIPCKVDEIKPKQEKDSKNCESKSDDKSKDIKPFVPCKTEEIKPGIRQPKESNSTDKPQKTCPKFKYICPEIQPTDKCSSEQKQCDENLTDEEREKILINSAKTNVILSPYSQLSKKENKDNEEILKTLCELKKDLQDCKKAVEKKKSAPDCTKIPSPKLDASLPKIQPAPKGLVQGSVGFLKTILSAFFGSSKPKPVKSKSVDNVRKKSSVKSVKKSKSDCEVKTSSSKSKTKKPVDVKSKTVIKSGNCVYDLDPKNCQKSAKKINKETKAKKSNKATAPKKPTPKKEDVCLKAQPKEPNISTKDFPKYTIPCPPCDYTMIEAKPKCPEQEKPKMKHIVTCSDASDCKHKHECDDCPEENPKKSKSESKLSKTKSTKNLKKSKSSETPNEETKSSENCEEERRKVKVTTIRPKLSESKEEEEKSDQSPIMECIDRARQKKIGKLSPETKCSLPKNQNKKPKKQETIEEKSKKRVEKKLGKTIGVKACLERAKRNKPKVTVIYPCPNKKPNQDSDTNQKQTKPETIDPCKCEKTKIENQQKQKNEEPKKTNQDCAPKTETKQNKIKTKVSDPCKCDKVKTCPKFEFKQPKEVNQKSLKTELSDKCNKNKKQVADPCLCDKPKEKQNEASPSSDTNQKEIKTNNCEKETKTSCHSKMGVYSKSDTDKKDKPKATESKSSKEQKEDPCKCVEKPKNKCESNEDKNDNEVKIDAEKCPKFKFSQKESKLIPIGETDTSKSKENESKEKKAGDVSPKDSSKKENDPCVCSNDQKEESKKQDCGDDEENKKCK